MVCKYSLVILSVNLKNSTYEILEVYNSNVYRVIDTQSTCTYIIKVCPEYETQRYKHQFKTEIDVLSKLNSFHAPRLITCFEDETTQYFVETYIPGTNARVWKQSYKGFVKKYTLLCDILDVLNALHKIGYLYIDLKLENIIVYQKHFYLIDFNACIENHAHVAVMASQSNCAPELLTLNEKDIRCDIYALGSLLKELFGLSMFFIIFLCHQRQERRISKISTFKFLLILHILIRILLVLSICILSVFFFTKGTSTTSTFDAYYNHHKSELFEKAYQESNSEDRLYTWISNDWILDEVYTNEQASLFLIKEAFKTQDATIIRYIYDRVNLKSFSEIQAFALVYLKSDAKRIDQCIKEINTSSLLLQDKLEMMNQCLQIALHEEFKISLNLVNDFIENVNVEQLLKYTDAFENLGCNYLEYLLLLKNKESEIMEVPEIFIDNLKGKRWNDLYAFWRSL